MVSAFSFLSFMYLILDKKSNRISRTVVPIFKPLIWKFIFSFSIIPETKQIEIIRIPIMITPKKIMPVRIKFLVPK